MNDNFFIDFEQIYSNLDIGMNSSTTLDDMMFIAAPSLLLPPVSPSPMPLPPKKDAIIHPNRNPYKVERNRSKKPAKVVKRRKNRSKGPVKVVKMGRSRSRNNRSQKLCCVAGCEQESTNRTKQSMRVDPSEGFKEGFLKSRKYKICDTHYFRSLYQWKKQTGKI